MGGHLYRHTWKYCGSRPGPQQQSGYCNKVSKNICAGEGSCLHFVKNTTSLKHNKAQCNIMRYACKEKGLLVNDATVLNVNVYWNQLELRQDSVGLAKPQICVFDRHPDDSDEGSHGLYFRNTSLNKTQMVKFAMELWNGAYGTKLYGNFSR